MDNVNDNKADKEQPTDTDFIKIINHLTINRPANLTSDGLFTKEFKERLNDMDELVRSKIIIPINEAIGLHNWAVSFIQNSDRFFCEIYADNETHFNTIQSIISYKLTDMDIELFTYKGTISDYKNNK